jgi:TonB family protein
MFDRLIESETADLKPRSRYFVISSVVVGLLFVSAVIASIYAGEIGLGSDQFEVSMLIAPPEITPTEPEPPRPQQQLRTQTTSSTVPQRRENIARLDEPLPDVPPVSVNNSDAVARPPGRFELGPANTQPVSEYTGGNSTNISGSSESVVAKPETSPSKPEPEPEPPPKPVVIRSLGVVNGIALTLPKPAYPATAIAMNAQGKVDVQITIDESGKVVSAKAVTGHPLLRPVSERAALGARFRPTTLSNVPVKVTGVIVYNFTRN